MIQNKKGLICVLLKQKLLINIWKSLFGPLSGVCLPLASFRQVGRAHTVEQSNTFTDQRSCLAAVGFHNDVSVSKHFFP